MVSICFVCELPILSHQAWDTWTQGPGIGSNPSALLNDIFHEDCLYCSVCMTRLKQGTGAAKRLANKIYCVLHYGDVTGTFGAPGDDFILKLRDFKRQSLGCAEARRKSSTTLSFAVPVQACPGAPYCSQWPHDIRTTSGYWTECRGGAAPLNVQEIHQYHSSTSSRSEGHCVRFDEDVYEDPDGEAAAETETTLLTSELSIGYHRHRIKPPPTPTVEAVLTRSSNSVADTTITKGKGSAHPGKYLHPTNIPPSCTAPQGLSDEQSRPTSKDDMDLMRFRTGIQQPFPNITITIVQPSSPPSSPPVPGKSGQTIEKGDSNSGTGNMTSSNNNTNSSNIRHNSISSTAVVVTTTTTSTTIINGPSQVISSGRRASISSLYYGSSSFVEHGKLGHQIQQQQQQQQSSASPRIEVEDTNNQSGSDGEIHRQDDPFELVSFEEEVFEKYFYGREHWNYFTNDEALGPVIMSLKQETLGGRDQFRVLLRTISYSMHGLVPTSAICADRYDREAVVRALGDEVNLKPPLVLGQLPSTSDELLKLDQVFVKSELKVGVIYVQEHQVNSEEAILGNRKESPAFAEFLLLLGERVRLKGFDKYKGGLDTVHDLTGTESVYTCYKNIEIMFHVSTMLPHEEGDSQKLQKKRHIGNDIVCVAFLEADDNALFWPGCIKSHFLHTFIVVKTPSKEPENGEKRKYRVAVVCRDEVTAFKPFLWHESEFEKNNHFREWLLTKIINGERASYSAPKFARMQDRTRSQMLEDIVNNLANHLATGQIPKPYRRGSWRPIGHMRPSSPLLDSVRDLFEGYDQLAKDFSHAFQGNAKLLCDVVFNVTGGMPMNHHYSHHQQQQQLLQNSYQQNQSYQSSQQQQHYHHNHNHNHSHSLSLSLSHGHQHHSHHHYPPVTNTGRRIYAVRAILAIRSRVFLEMLYGFAPPRGVGTSGSESKPDDLLARLESQDTAMLANIQASALSVFGTGNTSGSSSTKDSRRNSSRRSSSASSKRGSITAETKHMIASALPRIIAPSSASAIRRAERQQEREQRKASNASSTKTPTYLTVPGTGSASSGGGNMIKNAFNRLVSGSWSGWGSKGRNDSMKRWQSESFYAKMDANIGVEVPGLSVCADIGKIDRQKLAQTEFTIIEFDGDTFQLLIEYLHSGSCPLTCDTVPGLICAAEHFDLPDLLQACVHHTKTHLRVAVVPRMLSQLENYYWRYTSASQLVNTILAYVDARGQKLFGRREFLILSESMLTLILSRKTLLVSETIKFQVMLQWSIHKVSRGNYVAIERSTEFSSSQAKELQCYMRRLTRDLKLVKIPPQDIINVVLPTKTINHERILNTLLTQSNKTH